MGNRYSNFRGNDSSILWCKPYRNTTQSRDIKERPRLLKSGGPSIDSVDEHQRRAFLSSAPGKLRSWLVSSRVRTTVILTFFTIAPKGVR